MNNGLDQPGLCRSCTLAEQCTLPRLVDRPIMHCDAFNLGGLPRDLTPPPTNAALSDQAIAAAREHKGLCCNCENRDGCVFETRARPVLHCEEYR